MLTHSLWRGSLLPVGDTRATEVEAGRSGVQSQPELPKNLSYRTACPPPKSMNLAGLSRCAGMRSTYKPLLGTMGWSADTTHPRGHSGAHL